jgi:hypothetical protein
MSYIDLEPTCSYSDDVGIACCFGMPARSGDYFRMKIVADQDDTVFGRVVKVLVKVVKETSKDGKKSDNIFREVSMNPFISIEKEPSMGCTPIEEDGCHLNHEVYQTNYCVVVLDASVI